MGMMGNERGRRGRQTERHSQGESRSMRGGRGAKKRGRIERGAYRKRETQSGVRTFFFLNGEN